MKASELQQIINEEIQAVLEISMTRRFTKAVEALQKIQLEQQKLRKKFVAEKDPKKKEKLKQAIIKMHKAVQKAESNFNDAIKSEPVEDLDEGKLNEVTAKDTLTNAVNALTKTFGGKRLDKRYVKEYLKSIERMARKSPGKFVKDYGKFKNADWIEDVEYNLQNEGVLTEKRGKTAKQLGLSDEFDFAVADLKDKEFNTKSIVKLAKKHRQNPKKAVEYVKNAFEWLWKEGLNEISVKAGLDDVIKGRTSAIEGIKMSKDLAQALKDWIAGSSYGRKYGKHILKGRIGSLLKPANSWGIDRYLNKDTRFEWKKIMGKVRESVNEGKLDESMIGIKTKANFKPLQLKGALEKAGIKGFKMDRLSWSLTALKLDKKYFKKAKEIVDKLGLAVMMAKEGLLKEDVWKSFQGDIQGSKIYTAHNTEKRKSVQARKTDRVWDDGVPVLKYIARAPKKPSPLPKGKFKIIEDNKYGWWYYQVGRTWYGIAQGDYGTPPFEY